MKLLNVSRKLRTKLKALTEVHKINTKHFSKRKYPLITKVCPICQTPFATEKGHPKEKSRCSHSCSNKKPHTTQSKEKLSHSLRRRLSVKCVSCDNIFEKIPSSKKICCSRSCASKYHYTQPRYQEWRRKFTINLIRQNKFGWRKRFKNELSYPENCYLKIFLDMGFERGKDFTVNHPIGNEHGGFYYLDFYFNKLKINIEIDGTQHEKPDRLKSDKNRDYVLAKKGIKIVRIKWKKISTEAGKLHIQQKISELTKLLCT